MIVSLSNAITPEARLKHLCPACNLSTMLQSAGWKCLSGMATDPTLPLFALEPEFANLPNIEFVICAGQVCRWCLKNGVSEDYQTVWVRPGIYEAIRDVISGRTLIGDLSATDYLKLLGGADL